MGPVPLVLDMCIVHERLEVALTLVFMVIYITPTTWIGHKMRLMLTKTYNTVLIVIIVPLTLFPLYLL